jgi:hypothetical protein
VESQAGFAAATKEFQPGAVNPQVEASPPETGAVERASLESAGFGQHNSLNSVADAVGAEQIELARGLFDAVSVRFDVSAARPLQKPYVLLLLRYHEKGQEAGAPKSLVYAQALPKVDGNPRQVHLSRAGLPPGYTLDDVTVHLYDGGAEIATNLARKRLGLSADEAFQFAIVEYIEAHRGATLAPVLATKGLPATVRARFASAGAAQAYVKVGRNGQPLGAFADAECRTKLGDAELESALLTLRFNPALKEGRAVEGVARLTPLEVAAP